MRLTLSWLAKGALLTLLFLTACKKDEEILIPDNTPPPDGTIDNVIVDGYINRTYIGLIGRKPDSAEFAAGRTTLRAHNLSQADREAFAGSVFSNNRYEQHQFDWWIITLLQGIDTADVSGQIATFDLILSDSAFIFFWPAATYEKNRLLPILSAPGEYIAGTIDLAEVHKRLVNNYMYDQLNMGTQNFVISMFQNFLGRYPTEAERLAAEDMVNGLPSFLFLESGKNKDDFLRIFFESLDYSEGQVRNIYLRFLFREPDSQEMSTLSTEFNSTKNYNALLTKVITGDEYIGL